MLNLPNALTISRIFLVPLLVVVLLTRTDRWELIGGIIVGLAAVTDWLDGYLARRRQEVTPLGVMLDPVADKILISSALISLVQMELASAWIVVVLLGREFAVMGLRMVAIQQGDAIPPSQLGKLKMSSQVIAILLLILGEKFLGRFAILGTFALWVALGLAVMSGLLYFIQFFSRDARLRH